MVPIINDVISKFIVRLPVLNICRGGLDSVQRLQLKSLAETISYSLLANVDR